MNDVARVARVSLKTVSNVINGYQYIRPETRLRVEDAIRQLGYRVNLTARNLRQGRTGMIGLALPELSLSYFAELADSVIRAADDIGLTVLIEQTGAVRERELGALTGARRELTDGLILHPSALGQDDAAALSVPFPVVLLGERIFGGPVDHVTMANVEGAKAATQCLIAHGCRHIAVLGGLRDAPMGPSVLRTQGYRQALDAAGFEFDPRLVAEVDPWHSDTGAEAMRRLLDAGMPVDAVFAMNDAMAFGALHVLHERHILVPDEVEVIGFDNVGDAAYSIPPLTTIDPGREQIAKTAVHLLNERIQDPTDRPPSFVVADFDLIQRGSTKSSR